MTTVFEIEITLGEEKFPLLFNSKELAERFYTALFGMLTEKGKKEVKIKASEKSVFDDPKDIITELHKLPFFLNMEGQA